MFPIVNARALRVIATLFLMACAQRTAGLEPASGPIVTDRPDFTEGTATVPVGMAQLENGYTATREADVRGQTIGEGLLRIAVAERAEIRLGVNSYATTKAGPTRAAGFEDPSVGFKLRLVAPDAARSRLVPELSLLGVTTLPSRRGPFRESTVQPEAKLAAGWEVSERVGLSSNLGFGSATESRRRFSQLSASGSLGYAVSARVGAFAEYYGLTAGPGAGLAHYFDGGVTYLLTPNLQVDARGGAGANGPAPDRLWGVGLSTRW
jgi:hypothetical protein